jgi:hypothetical protein
VRVAAEKSKSSGYQFVLRCAFVAGKVIDRNILSEKPSFAKTMELDEEMDDIAASMPGRWWDLPHEQLSLVVDFDDLRDRVLQQYFFFHIRMYIHLPFMVRLSSTHSSTSPYGASKAQCMESSRQMLKLFQILHSEHQGMCLFECKTSDFVGFTAAVTLIIGLHSSRHMSQASNAEGDLQLLKSIKTLFIRKESKNSCKLISQCRKTISNLLDMLENPSIIVSSFDESQEIHIPYFGTIVQINQRHSSALPPSDHVQSNSNLSHTMTQVANARYAPESMDSSIHMFAFEYLGQKLSDPVESNLQTGSGNPGETLLNGQPFLLDPVAADIDQDWSTFLDYSDMSVGSH